MSLHSPEEQAEQAKETYQRGEYLLAAQEFKVAATSYKLKNDVIFAAEMANNQSVALLQAGETQKAYDALEGTEDVFINANDKLRLAMAYGNRAAALEGLKQIESALQAYQESAKMLKELGEDHLYAQVMQSLSSLQLKTGHKLEAMASMQAGVSAIEKPNFIQRILKKFLAVPFKRFKG